MAKIMVLVFTLVALTSIAESKPLSNAGEAGVAEEAYKRLKRADAPDVINSVSGLVTGILDTNWRYIAKINADKMKALSWNGYDNNQGYDSRNNNNGRYQRNYNRNNNYNEY